MGDEDDNSLKIGAGDTKTTVSGAEGVAGATPLTDAGATGVKKEPTATAATTIAHLPQVRLKKAIAKYSGESKGIQLEAWLTQVENMTSALGITEDQQKIAAAKDEIDYSSGEAKIIAKKTFRSWNHFKEVFRGWACAIPPTLHLDIERYFGCRWKPKQTFLAYTEELMDGFDRMVNKPQSKPEYVEVYYFYMVGTIIAQLPDAIRKEYLLKSVKIGSREDFDDWCLEINVKINSQNKSRPNSTILAMEDRTNRTTGARGKSSSRDTFSGKKATKPNEWEKKHGKCGRCMAKSHYRTECHARDPKCSICHGVHEFYECPRRNLKRSEAKPNGKSGDNPFLG